MDGSTLSSFTERADRKSDQSGLGPSARAVRLGVAALTVIATTIPFSAWAQAPDRASGSVAIRGVVVERGSETPITGANVRLTHESGSPAEARASDDSGEFTLPQIRPGTYTLVVDRIGYQAAQASVDLAGPEVHIRVELVPDAVQMDGLVVATRRSRPGLEGFDRRRESRMGGGTFFTREDIESRNPLRVTDLLRMVPGVQVTPGAGSWGNDVVMRGGCRPTLVVDGMRLQRADGFGLDELLSPHDLEGMEVYRSMFMPAEFGQGCGAVAVWTRRGDPERGSPLTWKRLVAALGLVGGILLLAR